MLPKDLALTILAYVKLDTLKLFTKNIKLLSNIREVTEAEFLATNLSPIDRALELLALKGIRIEPAAVGLVNPIVSAALALEQNNKQLWLYLIPSIKYYFNKVITNYTIYTITKNEEYWLIRLFNIMDFGQFRGLIPDNEDALIFLALMAKSDNIDLFNHSLVFYTNRPVDNINIQYYADSLTYAASIVRNMEAINILIEYNLFSLSNVVYDLDHNISRSKLLLHYPLYLTFYADVILHNHFDLINSNLASIHICSFGFCLLLLGYWDIAIELIKNKNINYDLVMGINFLAFLNGKIRPPPTNWIDSYNTNKPIITKAIIIIAGRLNLPQLIDKLDFNTLANVHFLNDIFLSFTLPVAQKLENLIVNVDLGVGIIANEYNQIYNFQTVSYFINYVSIESISSFTIDQVLQLINNNIIRDEAIDYLTNFSFLPTLYQPYLNYTNFVSDLKALVNSINLINYDNFWLLRHSLANYVNDQQDVANCLQSIGTSQHLKAFAEFNHLPYFIFNPNHKIRIDLKS